jgi:hypothetical protein
VIESVSAPVRNVSGNYSFEAKASVPTEDALTYVLFSDEQCSVEVTRNDDGKFDSVAPSQSSCYYLRVLNVMTSEWSETKIVKGFVKQVMYEKITKDELERIANSGDYGTAPKGFSHRFAPGLTIIAKGMNPEERKVQSLSDVCDKIMMGTWSSITVESIDYDSQNRIKKLVFIVNYPS